MKGAFVIKEVVSGTPLLEVTPRQLRRLARATGGWVITRKEGRASSPD
ncbi:MAG: hypothetical protein IMW89_15565 [Ktedonobacteraceae bacterium]|nr:hypothetical protein [Ktedonobacteraceae bacterium]